MPRDLESEHQTIQGLAPLSRTEDRPGGTAQQDVASPPIIQSPEPFEDDDEPRDRLQRDMMRNDKRNALHPFTSAITVNHVDESVVVEEACFPPEERCSREKFEYRFSTCGEICLGIYTTAYIDPQHPITEDDDEYEPHPAQYTRSPPLPSADLLVKCSTASVSPTSDAGDGKPRKRMLIGHIVSTRSFNETIKDSDMALPSSWQPAKSSNDWEVPAGNPTSSGQARPAPSDQGHQTFGPTVCLHSLAVLPQYSNLGIGSALLSAYIERIKSSGGTDRIALLAHDHLVSWYERFGFEDLGKSEATFGGGEWNDMVYTFPPPEEPPIQSLVGR